MFSEGEGRAPFPPLEISPFSWLVNASCYHFSFSGCFWWFFQPNHSSGSVAVLKCCWISVAFLQGWPGLDLPDFWAAPQYADPGSEGWPPSMAEMEWLWFALPLSCGSQVAGDCDTAWRSSVQAVLTTARRPDCSFSVTFSVTLVACLGLAGSRRFSKTGPPASPQWVPYGLGSPGPTSVFSVCNSGWYTISTFSEITNV